MSPRTITTTDRSEAPPARVFEVLADAPRWKDWARFSRSEYEREGDPPPHGVGAVRRFGSRVAASREEVVAYEPPHHFAYVLLSGLPVRNYRADVNLTPDGAGTRITWTSTFEPKIPGTGRIMSAFLGSVVRDFARRLARHAAE
jgi:uncharacterized protein YndB with AHSA1/START domain